MVEPTSYSRRGVAMIDAVLAFFADVFRYWIEDAGRGRREKKRARALLTEGFTAEEARLASRYPELESHYRSWVAIREAEKGLEEEAAARRAYHRAEFDNILERMRRERSERQGCHIDGP
jgi:hypothetical protein